MARSRQPARPSQLLSQLTSLELGYCCPECHSQVTQQLTYIPPHLNNLAYPSSSRTWCPKCQARLLLEYWVKKTSKGLFKLTIHKFASNDLARKLARYTLQTGERKDGE